MRKLTSTIQFGFILLILLSCKQNNTQIEEPEENIKETDSIAIEVQPLDTIAIAKVYKEPYTEVFDTIIGNKFRVDRVKQAPTKLKTYPILNAFEMKTKNGIVFIPEEHRNIKIVPSPGNALMNTIHESYANHRPLTLSPDHIWTAICQGASIHINKHFKKLEAKIFKENKPKELLVRNDSLKSTGEGFDSIINGLSSFAGKYTNEDMYNFFVQDFSTTSPIQTKVYQITMLESFKKAFRYVAESGCGIPSITIQGKPEDWKKIKNNIQHLDHIEMGYWRKVLEPVIDEFIAASEGRPNKKFWKLIYKDATGYGPYRISGWFIKLFPYIERIDEFMDYEANSDNYGRNRASLKYQTNKYIYGDDYLASHLTTKDFPSGVSEIEITWKDHFNNKIEKMIFNTGFMGTKQYKDGTIEPFTSWCISKKGTRKKAFKYSYFIKENKKIQHQDDYWSSRTVDISLFNGKIRNERSHGASRFNKPNRLINNFDSLKGLHLYCTPPVNFGFPKSLDSNPEEALRKMYDEIYELSKISRDSSAVVEFILTVNGSIIKYKSKGIPSRENNKIRHYISSNRRKWQNSMSDPNDVLMVLDENPDSLELVPVNSKVQLYFNFTVDKYKQGKFNIDD